MYPDVVEITPGTLSKSASTHQKHPPAKIAVAVFGACACAPPIAAASRQAARSQRLMSATSQVVLLSHSIVPDPSVACGQLRSQTRETVVILAARSVDILGCGAIWNFPYAL